MRETGYEDEERAAAIAARERQERWRRVFGSEDGREVLVDILGALHCLETSPPTPEVVIRQNIGHWILAELGVMQQGQERHLVDAFLSLDPKLDLEVERFFSKKE